MQRIGSQGFPAKDTIKEVYAAARDDALEGVQEYGRWILPWVKWQTKEEVAQNDKDRLRSEAQPLIEAWIRRFEPENAEAYRQQGVI